MPEGFAEHWLFPQDEEPVRLNQRHGEWLHELSEHYDLAWGTSLTATDRELLGVVLDLPVFVGAVTLPEGRFDPALKVPAIDAVAGSRALAWFDDLLTPDAFAWADTRDAPTLLIRISPATGLERAHVDRLLKWVTSSE